MADLRKRQSPLTAKEKYSEGYERKYNLKKNYGMTLRDYDVLFRKQKGCCAICERHQSDFNFHLAVDHDHKTGMIRGLLCQRCNQILGYFNDSRGFFMKAIRYLGRS
ncbi:hypothetical protein LCGC14_0681570 [marine sediment metagenome]|uniref:Recombination endonuclease VII n=1 Tax=marine sediment metagenome TaxID=412755 RepID=A0A0F9R8C4_9ZZZZ